MYKKFEIGLLIVIIAFIAAGFAYVLKGSKESAVVGAVNNCGNTTCLTGLIVSGQTYAQGGMSEGGINSTSTPASLTLQASDFASVSLLSDTPTVGSITLTLPASSTLSQFLPNVGDSEQFFIVNATSTAGTNITIAGGTGSLLEKSSTTTLMVAGGSATVDAFRKANTDIVFIVNTAL